MKSLEFVTAYDRDISAAWQNRYSGELAERMAPALEHSHRFGQILHDNLSGQEPPLANIKDLNDYNSWSNQYLPALYNTVLHDESDQAHLAMNELNFHRLNFCMQSMWKPIFDGQWLPERHGDRSNKIKLSQELLALQGLSHYYEREKLSSERAGFAYFAQHNQKFRQSNEGAVNEFDAAIILLDVLRQKAHQQLTVVPAPLQFESRAGRANADFVIVHESGEAVGVQMKSLVSEHTMASYDPNRIVLIDARIDLGNELAKRTSPTSSNVHRVSWAGIICAHRVLQINTSDKSLRPLMEALRIPKRAVIISQMLAHELLGNIKPMRNDARRYIGERIAKRIDALQSI